jgi:hypothetical protein
MKSNGMNEMDLIPVGGLRSTPASDEVDSYIPTLDLQ